MTPGFTTRAIAQPGSPGRAAAVPLCAALAFTALALVVAGSARAGEGQGQPARAVAGPAQPAAAAQAPGTQPSPIDVRVQLLARELGLDERQQAAVRKILVQQRSDVQQAWANESRPAQLRVADMRAIGDRTSGKIRALLDERQREKFTKARPVRAEHPETASKLDSWIGAVGNK